MKIVEIQDGLEQSIDHNQINLKKLYQLLQIMLLSHNYNPNNLLNLDTNLNLTDISLERKNANKDGKRDYDNRNIGLKVQNHFDFNLSSTKNRVSIGTEYQKAW